MSVCEQFDIQLQRESGVYYGGEVVRGKVCIRSSAHNSLRCRCVGPVVGALALAFSQRPLA
eukprot:scaffold7500_cov286-Pinguiococcus_pyrenoidosus.AAC.3